MGCARGGRPESNVTRVGGRGNKTNLGAKTGFRYRVTKCQVGAFEQITEKRDGAVRPN